MDKPKSQKYLYIYLPGLGEDRFLKLSKLIVWLWSRPEREVLILNSGWSRRENLSTKIQRLKNKLSEIRYDNYLGVAFVGSSAGAPLAVVLKEELHSGEINSVVSVCGKLIGAETIGERYQRRSPALKETVAVCESIINQLDKTKNSRIFSLYPLYDKVVGINYMRAPLIVRKRVLAVGHVLSIIVSLTFYRRNIFEFVEHSKS